MLYAKVHIIMFTQRKPLLCVVVSIFFVLYVLLILWIALPPSTSTTTTLAELDNLLQTRWAEYAQPRIGWTGSLAVYIVTPSKGTYFSSTSTDRIRNDHFRAASTTKTFTAASIMLLNQSGRLGIDEKMTTYVNYAIPYAELITIRQLLEHRGGVWDVTNEPFTQDGKSYTADVLEQDPNHQFTIDELVNVLVTNNLTYGPPGLSYNYSNTGYSILCKIIETVSAQRFDDYVRANFVLPNSLVSTSFPWRAEEQTLPVPFVIGYTWSQNVSYEKIKLNPSGNVAEGNIVTTLVDLSNWFIRLFTGATSLTLDTVETMTETKPSVENMRYGLGINYIPGLGYGHDGGIDGYATNAYYDPYDQITIVLSASSINADDIAAYYAFLHKICGDAKKIVAK